MQCVVLNYAIEYSMYPNSRGQITMTVILIEADIQNEKRGNKKDKVKDENKKRVMKYMLTLNQYTRIHLTCVSLYYFKILEKCQHTHGLSGVGNWVSHTYPGSTIGSSSLK